MTAFDDHSIEDLKQVIILYRGSYMSAHVLLDLLNELGKRDKMRGFLFIVTPIVGVCNCSMFCCTLLCVRSSIAIILMVKRELVALLNLSSACLVMVERLFLAMPQGCLRFVIVVFPDHTHLLFLPSILSLFRNEFNKFKNTGARMLDSVYHMTLRLLLNLISGVKRYSFVIMYATLLWTSYVQR